MTIEDYCRNVNFELNLFELINFLFVIVLVTVIVLVVKKVVLALKTERKIDERLRETRARISNVVTEIEEYKDRICEVGVEVGVEVEVEEKETTTKLTQTVDELTTEFVMETLTQAKTKDTKQLIKNVKQNTLEEEVPCIQEVSEVALKGKKTREMSMEERWAEFDNKRSMRNTA